MIREIIEHKVEGDLPQNQLKVTVVDEPGQGGASHAYLVDWYDAFNNPTEPPNSLDTKTLLIHFQEGPIKEFGVNGVTQEVLIAIVMDRLKSFQAGPFPSPDNEAAYEHLKAALEYLQTRTKKRIARGVEGTITA